MPRYLTCNPFCHRVCCDVGPDEVSAVEPDDDEGIEQFETDSWNNEQVNGENVRRVVAQEGPPSLAGRPCPLNMDLATLDCAITCRTDFAPRLPVERPPCCRRQWRHFGATAL